MRNKFQSSYVCKQHFEVFVGLLFPEIVCVGHQKCIFSRCVCELELACGHQGGPQFASTLLKHFNRKLRDQQQRCWENWLSVENLRNIQYVRKILWFWKIEVFSLYKVLIVIVKLALFKAIPKVDASYVVAVQSLKYMSFTCGILTPAPVLLLTSTSNLFESGSFEVTIADIRMLEEWAGDPRNDSHG